MIRHPQREAVKIAEVLELVREGETVIRQRVERAPDLRRRISFRGDQLEEEHPLAGDGLQHLREGLSDKAVRHAAGGGGERGEVAGALKGDLGRTGERGKEFGPSLVPD